MKTAAVLLSQTFLYDFSQIGGAIGSYNTGIQIPVGTTVIPFATSIISQLNWAGTSTFALGTSKSATLFGSNSTTGPIGPQSFQFFFGTNACAIMDDTLNVLFSIITSPLTSGKFSCCIQYYLFQ